MPVTMDHGHPAVWKHTIQERRQHIADTARCQCGATAKGCREGTSGDQSGPGSLCCWGGIPGHGHVEDPHMVDQLLKEVMAGEVRTVAEAYPPPVQGPTLPGYDWLLHQDTWWYPHRRPAVRITGMDKPWRFNVAQLLERKAARLHMSVRMRYMHNAPDDVWASFERENPVEWLQETPLMRALRKGLPGGGAKLRALQARAVHWNTCPMRLAPEKRPRGPHDTDPACVCVKDGTGRTVGATNDPAAMKRRPERTREPAPEWTL